VIKPVFLITLGSVAGMVGAAIASGLVGVGVDAGAVLRPLAALIASPRAAAPASRAAPQAAAATAQGAFSFCLHKAGGDVEGTLRDLLAFHDHEATLALTECLLNVEPQRFCPPDGAAKAENAMEIYLWSRDVARVRTAPHGLADKIRLLDRTNRTNDAAGSPDPFTLTWSGPRDRALFERLRTLARDGYLDPGAFGYSGRPELREALTDIQPRAAPCAGVAGAD
jgi:hypothetical protein